MNAGRGVSRTTCICAARRRELSIAIHTKRTIVAVIENVALVTASTDRSQSRSAGCFDFIIFFSFVRG